MPQLWNTSDIFIYIRTFKEKNIVLHYLHIFSFGHGRKQLDGISVQYPKRSADSYCGSKSYSRQIQGLYLYIFWSREVSIRMSTLNKLYKILDHETIKIDFTKQHIITVKITRMRVEGILKYFSYWIRGLSHLENILPFPHHPSTKRKNTSPSLKFVFI